MPEKSVRRVAIVGAGSVGASWAAFYLARGFDVIVADPVPGVEAKLRRAIDAAWFGLKVLGISPKGSPDHLCFTTSIAEGVSGVDFIQECGPDDYDQNVGLFAEIERIAAAEVVIASSSANLAISKLQAACRHPERCVTGHAMNPPHLMPLVEIAGGKRTSAQAIRWAFSFYASVGKKPIFVRSELPGLVANHICAAMVREIDLLVAQGMISSADADTTLRWGPGLRWVLAGADPTISSAKSPKEFTRAYEAELAAMLRLRSKSVSPKQSSPKPNQRDDAPG